MGTLRVIDLSILPPLVDLISYHVLQTATDFVCVNGQAQIILIFRAANYINDMYLGCFDEVWFFGLPLYPDISLREQRIFLFLF